MTRTDIDIATTVRGADVGSATSGREIGYVPTAASLAADEQDEITDSTGISPHRPHLLAQVELIAPVLLENADSSEDAHQLAPASVAALRDCGLLAALSPTTVGGWHVDPLTEMELIEAVSRLDASTGWSFWATAGSTARVASMLPETAVAEVFAPGRPAPLIAFQERAFSNVAVPEAGGLRLSGSWPFGTGVTHADWVVAVAAVASGVRPRRCPDGDLVAAVVPISQFERSGVWDASGLSGTGTYGYTIEDVVVSWDQVWAYPPGPPLRGGAHFCFRRAPIKHTGFALGVAASSLTLFVDHLAARVGTTREPSVAVTTDVARCSLRLAAARALAFETVGGVWADVRSLEGVSPASQGRLRAVARYVTEVAVDVCAVVMRHGDASLLARQNPLQRNLRDITAAAAHAEVNHAALEELGMSLLADGAPAAAAGRWSA